MRSSVARCMHFGTAVGTCVTFRRDSQLPLGSSQNSSPRHAARAFACRGTARTSARRAGRHGSSAMLPNHPPRRRTASPLARVSIRSSAAIFALGLLFSGCVLPEELALRELGLASWTVLRTEQVQRLEVETHVLSAPERAAWPVASLELFRSLAGGSLEVVHWEGVPDGTPSDTADADVVCLPPTGPDGDAVLGSTSDEPRGDSDAQPVVVEKSARAQREPSASAAPTCFVQRTQRLRLTDAQLAWLDTWGGSIHDWWVDAGREAPCDPPRGWLEVTVNQRSVDTESCGTHPGFGHSVELLLLQVGQWLAASPAIQPVTPSAAPDSPALMSLAALSSHAAFTVFEPGVLAAAAGSPSLASRLQPGTVSEATIETQPDGSLRVSGRALERITAACSGAHPDERGARGGAEEGATDAQACGPAVAGRAAACAACWADKSFKAFTLTPAYADAVKDLIRDLPRMQCESPPSCAPDANRLGLGGRSGAAAQCCTSDHPHWQPGLTHLRRLLSEAVRATRASSGTDE